MSAAPHCKFCGQPIMFRFMQGRCVPMHPEGGCPGHRDAGEGDPKPPDCLYATSCPKCDEPVFFLRHNGGCTWLDDVPYPWPKHACFLDQSDPAPVAWQALTTTPGNGIVVRLHIFSSGRLTASLTPVDRTLRRRFRDLGTFDVITDDSLHFEPIESRLAFVTVATPADGRGTKYRAVTLQGEQMLLIPRRR